MELHYIELQVLEMDDSEVLTISMYEQDGWGANFTGCKQSGIPCFQGQINEGGAGAELGCILPEHALARQHPQRC